MPPRLIVDQRVGSIATRRNCAGFGVKSGVNIELFEVRTCSGAIMLPASGANVTGGQLRPKDYISKCSNFYIYCLNGTKLSRRNPSLAYCSARKGIVPQLRAPHAWLELAKARKLKYEKMGHTVGLGSAL
jgi:hypothetical protein